MKKSTKRATIQKTDSADWFDTKNASLIIWCATFGVFGVHKFIQHKKGQGILFILLDLTLVGLIVSWIWATIDLICLTAKPNNKPANMIFGSVFILFNCLALIPGGATYVSKYVINQPVAEESAVQQEQVAEPEIAEEISVEEVSVED